MAYIETTPSRLGQVNAANDVNALFLKQFAGEVLTTFELENVMMPLHTVRSISSGKSAQFPTTGVASATYHTPGESLLTTDNAGGGVSKYLSKIKHAERVINIDEMLVSSAFISNIDEAKNHYDVRSIYSTEIGRQLAYIADKNLIRSVIAGARASTDRFGGTGTTPYLGGVVTYDDEAPSGSPATVLADELVKPFFSAAQAMDEKGVPQNDRYAVVTPAFYYQLVNVNKDVISRDFNPEGNGSKAGGYIVQVAGIRIMKSNNIPTTDESSDTTSVHTSPGILNDVFGTANGGYGTVSFAKTKGIIFQREAVGTVKLLDLAVESDYSIERQGTLMVAKYAMGHGVLRNECCYEIAGD